MKDLRVAVVITQPSFHAHMVPLGYLYVSAALKQTGMPVSIIRAPSSMADEAARRSVRDALETIRPDIVFTGTSYKFHNNCPSSTVGQAIKVSELTKETLGECTTLLIGPLNAVLYPYLLDCPDVNGVVLGEPESVCRGAVAALAEGGDLAEVPGLAIRGPDGPRQTGATPYPNPDSLPMPDREGIDFADYVFRTYYAPRTTEVLTSRGCPFDCTYCFGARTSQRNAFNTGPPFRAASPQRVVEEIDLLYHRWGVRGIKFSDVEFCVSADRVRSLCELLLAKGYEGLAWRAVTRATSVDPSLLRLMYDAGCRHIYYGVESGDPDLLQAMKKQVTLDEIREVFRHTKACGIKPEASFLLGVPGETEESVERTIRFAIELDPFLATFHVFVPFPGIPMSADLSTIADNALDDWDVYQLSGGRSYCHVPADRLDDLSRKAYRRFYLRGRSLLRMGLELRHPAMRKFLASLIAGRYEGSWFWRMLLSRRG
ncbi:MAG: radical SAM protein [Phycisphaerae bacterium]|nr:radical SAM protein [Phycisphaerae bacterium]